MSTFAHPWNDPSSCNLNFLTCQRMSSLPPNFMLSKPLRVMCTFASKRACMAFHEQESLPKNYWRTTSMHSGTIKAQSHLVSANTTGTHLRYPMCR
ncbi:hypothetical protein ACHAW6_009878 [Cyclotella cf. meneghiniana]